MSKAVSADRRNIIILFFSLIVVMLGFGIIIPIMPFYIDAFGAGGAELGALMATFAAMQFIFAPIWGQLSDRYGRKPVMMLGVFGNAISLIMFGLSSQLWMLFLARILGGILSSATIPTAMAYIGDSTSEKNRGGGMGVLGAAMGIGMVIGPALGGILGENSLSAPFFLAAALSFVALALIFIILPESLPPEARTKERKRETFSGQLKQIWRAIYSPIGTLLILAFLLSFGLTSFEGVFGLFALERYGYGAREVGLLLMAIGITSAFVQLVLTGPLTKRWGEANIIKVAFLGSAIGFGLMLLPKTLIGVGLTASLFVIFNALLRPAVASLISLRTTTGQGVAMGLNNSLMSLGRIAGPLWAGALFDFNYNMPYLSGGIIMFVGFIASLVWLRDDQPEQTPPPSAVPNPTENTVP